MKKNITWEVLNKFQIPNSKFHSSNLTENLIDIILKNRSITEKEEFLNPDITKVTAKSVGIDSKQLQKTVARIKKAKEKKEQIIVYGDYDADGITGTAIVWEALNRFGANVSPFIPSRVEEGYGLSIKGIEHILSDFPDTKIIITVDNGIVANQAVDFASSKGIDVVITDHHVIGPKLPNAFAIVHTTKLCGAGVGWILSREFLHDIPDHLALVALATVADLVPLFGANRTVLKKGLEILHTTKRPGIIALCAEAGINQQAIGVYEIGHILAPRLNAMGRISNAMDSLRLLCTKDKLRAKALAEKHGFTNKDRQELTQSLSEYAITESIENTDNIIFVANETYDEGVIGLVAGRLVETYYRPSIVVAKKEKISKASARSISGFNIIEFIRSGSHLLINAGGHPMAAGFTIATEKIAEFKKFVRENAKKFDTSLLRRKLKIDCEIPLGLVSQKLYDTLQILEPFGMGNPEPTFVSKAKIVSIKQIGKDKNHLSLVFQSPHHDDHSSRHPEPALTAGRRSEGSNFLGLALSFLVQNDSRFSAIAFGIGERFAEFTEGQEVKIVYTISENEWNKQKNLQLKIKDICFPS